ncbi:tyrosine-type recombinase/integrase [Marinobacter nauticus]|uniref:Phage integrase family protein n=1 Tax=Marinobacter nauticus TaxID=2743 RepID=A0A368UT90_MARNT|nr:tyrosine-type recombinase/integrase [Marinobacter nauticus]RBP69596.1 phage integrase family protein [Marinobacter nauticus]RCW31240.1 phage integrase family protein [Marinobacter nauticus]
MAKAKLTSITEPAAAKFEREASERDTMFCKMQPGLHLIKLKRGCSWRYRYEDDTGKRCTVTIGKLSQLLPEQAARKVIDWIDREANPLEEKKQRREQALSAAEEAERRTLRHYLEHGYREHMKSWKPQNAKANEQRINLYFADLLDKDMATITRRYILDTWQPEASKGRAHDTVKRAYGSLKTLLAQAVQDEVLGSSPLEGVKLNPPAHVEQEKQEEAKDEDKKNRRPLTDSEIKGIMTGLEAYAEEIREGRRNSRKHGKPHLKDLDAVNYPHWFIPFTHLALHTGLRTGDLRTLTWNELNIQFGRLIKTTEKSKVALRKGKKPAVVDLKLNDRIKGIMTAWWQDQGKPEDGLVFPSPRGGKMLATLATRAPWKRVKELGGIDPDLVFYAFRHHFISVRLAAGEPLFKVARMVGHKSVAMIEEHYGHLCEQDQNEAVDVVGDAIERVTAKEAAV